MLARTRRTLLVVDVVESMRLMREFEDDMVRRWPAFVRSVRADLLQRHRGTMVKSLGDGMLLGFEEPADGVACALALHQHLRPFNDGCGPQSTIWLRTGVHVGNVVCEDFDWFGSAVNVAARLAALAGPGEGVASVDIRDLCAPGVDAEFDDLGECFLKHEPEPVRCYRLRPVEADVAGVPLPAPDRADRATIAIVPFAERGDRTDTGEFSANRAFGDALAEALISAFSNRRDWQVLARVSTAAFRSRPHAWATMRRTLGATYALHGTYALRDGRAAVEVSLHDVRRQTLLWHDAVTVRVDELFAAESAFVPDTLAAATRAINAHELRCAHALPVPTLDDYGLYAGGVTLMNRLSAADFSRAGELFVQLQERAPRAASPHAMLARWHVLCMAQGWSTDRERQAAQAQAAARRALQLQPNHALALCVDGLRSMHAPDGLDIGAQRLQAAIDADPHEPAAWTWMSGLRAYRDEGDAAVAAADRAIALSPLDPARYSIDSYRALALLVAGRYDESIEACRASLRLNRGLGASHRTLAQALALAGRVDEARAAMQRLLAAEPSSTVRAYRRVYPGRNSAHMERFVEALRIAGLPE